MAPPRHGAIVVLIVVCPSSNDHLRACCRAFDVLRVKMPCVHHACCLITLSFCPLVRMLHRLHIIVVAVCRYGVPMDGARRFEEALRLHMPHLFRKDRDLLHQLTVTLAPHILMHTGTQRTLSDTNHNRTHVCIVNKRVEPCVYVALCTSGQRVSSHPTLTMPCPLDHVDHALTMH